MMIGVKRRENIDALVANGYRHGQSVKSQTMKIVVFSPPPIDFTVSMRCIEKNRVVYVSHMSTYLMMSSGFRVDPQ